MFKQKYLIFVRVAIESEICELVNAINQETNEMILFVASGYLV